MTHPPLKKTAAAFFVVAAMAAGPVQAQFLGPSVSGRGAGVTTVAEASQVRKDTRVVLEGTIVEHQRSDYFTFEDPTGRITVEIDNHVFRGQQVTPETRVRLRGEVDRNSRGRYIDVDWLEVLSGK